MSPKAKKKPKRAPLSMTTQDDLVELKQSVAMELGANLSKKYSSDVLAVAPDVNIICNVKCVCDKLVPIAEIKAKFHPRNPNKHSDAQVAHIGRILKYQGARRPVNISNQSDYVIVGHGRILAAEAIGWTHYPVNFQDYEDDAQEYADMVADNALQEQAELDLGAINRDIVDLGPDFEVDMLGIPDFVVEPADKYTDTQDEPSDALDEDDGDKDAVEEKEDVIPERIEPRVKAGESYRIGAHTVHNGDCLRVLKTLANDSLDSLVTDPPAGIAFMGKEWDEDKGGSKEWIAWMRDVMKEALRVLKPGSHGLVWAIPRTSHWTASALEDAGFEVRDVITHVFGSGFPKSLDVSKQLDKAAGAEREVIGMKTSPDGRKYAIEPAAFKGEHGGDNAFKKSGMNLDKLKITEPSTEDAKRWAGFGTALKPASEHWILVRKPCSEDTVAKNVLRWGCGAINVDASRIGTQDKLARPFNDANNDVFGKYQRFGNPNEPQGRFPANLILSHNDDCVEVGTKKVGAGEQNIRKAGLNGGALKDHFNNKPRTVSDDAPDMIRSYGTETVSAWECSAGCAVAELDAQSGHLAGRGSTLKDEDMKSERHNTFTLGKRAVQLHENNGGGASRFFYVAKPSKRERNAGCEALPEKPGGSNAKGYTQDVARGLDRNAPTTNHHPTVKPTRLMQYLITMVTPPEGVVLDMFGGSGTTLVAAHGKRFASVLIEQSPEYCDIILARAEHWTEKSATLLK